MNSGRDAREKPIVRDRLDVMNKGLVHRARLLLLVVLLLLLVLLRVTLVRSAVGPSSSDDGVDSGLLDGFSDDTSHLEWVGDDDRTETDEYDLLLLRLGFIEEVEQLLRRFPFLRLGVVGVVEPPVPGDVDVLAPIQRRRDDDGREVVEEGDLVLSHCVEVGRAELEELLAPAVDLTRCRSPEDLIEHGIGLCEGRISGREEGRKGRGRPTM
jgi:hypothetical protein